MSRCRFILACAALALSACSGTDVAAPTRNLTPIADRGVVPGSNGSSSSSTGAHSLACDIPSPLFGKARIGPSGGVLDIAGGHRLIVPPGALTKDTTITGTVSTTSPTVTNPLGTVVIEFQPSGLHFKKPAGLIFNASSCGPVPDAVYLNPIGTSELIPAIYSNWWHTIAAPIEHFSIYAINLG